MLEQVVVVALIALGLGHLMAKLAGPFGVAGAVRAFLLGEWLPAWVRGGAVCPFCWAFWGAALGTALSSGGGVPFVTIWLAGYGLAVLGLLYTGH